MVLSHATSATMPSNMWPRAMSSIESAITSRLTSDVFMPSVPIVMPSLMAMVLNSIGRAAGGADAFLHVNREIAQFVIAVHRFGPRIGDADDRLLQIGVVESDGLQIAAGGGAIASLRDGVAVEFHSTVWIMG